MKRVLLILFLAASIDVFGQNDSIEYVKPLFDFRPERPMFEFSKEQVKNNQRLLRYYSLTKYREGVTPTDGGFGTTFKGFTDTIKGTRTLYMYNLSIQEMVTHFYDWDNQVLLEVQDPSRYRYIKEYGSKESWLRKNGFCFELMLPIKTVSTAILNDILANVLSLKITRQDRKVPVIVLYKLSDQINFSSEGLKLHNDIKNDEYKNIEINDLATSLRKDGRFFVNDTKYNGTIRLDSDISDWNDLNEVNSKLKKYGLSVREEIRSLNLLVIAEPSFKKNTQ
jgi:hypothetical protein